MRSGAPPAMLQGLRRKFAVHRVYRHVRKLFDDVSPLTKGYVTLSPVLAHRVPARLRRDLSTYSAKLKEFLEQFQLMYQQYVEGTTETLDRIMGDCADVSAKRRCAQSCSIALPGCLQILSLLIDWADRGLTSRAPAVVQLHTKALQVVEVILRDEKYRLQVSTCSDL